MAGRCSVGGFGVPMRSKSTLGAPATLLRKCGRIGAVHDVDPKSKVYSSSLPLVSAGAFT